MERRYRLLALDMDGTLLDSNKRVLPRTAEALRELAESGVALAFCTGRNASELGPYLGELPFVRYGALVSGALAFDLHERRTLHVQPLTTEDALAVIEAGELEGAMAHVLAVHDSVVRTRDLEQLEEFHMGVYRPLYEGYARHVDDPRDYVRAHEGEVLKVNLYHRNADSRNRTRTRLARLPLTVVDAETTSLESTSRGISKARGLQALCDHLGCTMDDVAMVGDADNDLEALAAVGMPVAMGNATEEVKSLARLVVADNDHDGIAELIARLHW